METERKANKVGVERIKVIVTGSVQILSRSSEQERRWGPLIPVTPLKESQVKPDEAKCERGWVFLTNIQHHNICIHDAPIIKHHPHAFVLIIVLLHLHDTCGLSYECPGLLSS